MTLILRFIERLTGYVKLELEQLVATIQAGWDVEHERDGSHGDVTANSVTVSGTGGFTVGGVADQPRIQYAASSGMSVLSAANANATISTLLVAVQDATYEPDARAGYAQIYVDINDGDLKVKFGDGTVKTLATDT